MPPRSRRHPHIGRLALATVLLAGGCRLADAGRGLVAGPAGRGEAESLRITVRDGVAALLSRHVPAAVVQASFETSDTSGPAAKRICIVPLAAPGPDGEQLAPRLGAIIQQRIDESDAFEAIAPRFIAAGLEAAGLRPAGLREPAHRGAFTAFMEQQGQEFDYLLLAEIEPATTVRESVLTLNLVDARTGAVDEVRHSLTASGPWWLPGRGTAPPTEAAAAGGYTR